MRFTKRGSIMLDLVVHTNCSQLYISLRMNLIEFKEISLKNLDEVIGLQVGPDQTNLVADNLYSIAQAGLDPTGWCRAAYLDGEPVGFFFIKEEDEGRRIYICRFMVDEKHQGRGLGRRIMMQLLDLLFSSPTVEIVDLAVSREPRGAGRFYKKCGFISTEEAFRGGFRMFLSRSDHRP
jgi:diamine N-acetyltransferase